MTTSTRKILHWTPRVFGILYALFISLFALDVWGTGAGFWEELAAFAIHLLPTYFILAALVVAWKEPRIGGIAFIALAAAFGMVFGRGDIAVLLLLALVPTAIGLLFIADGCVNRDEMQLRM